MLKKLSIQRSLMGIVGLLMITGMVILTATLVVMQKNAREARDGRLAAFFQEMSDTNASSLSQMGAAVSGIIGREIEVMKNEQTDDLVAHQKERATQLALLISSFVAPYLARSDDAQIDDVCRSAAYDSDIGVLLVEDDEGYYYGGYYREDHPGLLKRISPDGEPLPFGPDRVARTLLEEHADSVYEVRAPIQDPRNITRRIGWTKLVILDDRIVREKESLSERADVLKNETVTSLASEAGALSRRQNDLMTDTMRLVRKEGEDSDHALNHLTILVILLILAGVLTAIFLLSKRLLQPLQQATEFAASLGAGDLSRRLAPGEQYDARLLTRALNAMADALEARGKETQGALSELRGVLSRVNGIADRLDGGAHAIAESSHGFAGGLADLRGALEEMAGTMAEMEQHSARNAENAALVTSMSEETMAKTREGREEMRAVTESMNLVTDVYARLSGMVKTIDDIAFQTNLLALNASVEAAHAGRAGKGFTVVADEVRRLSMHSAKAAAQAKDEMAIADSQIEEAMNRARVTSEALAAISDSTREVSQALDTVKNSSNEQLDGVRHANATMDRIAIFAKQGLDEARRIASTTTMLSDMARQLNAMLDKSAYVKRSTRPDGLGDLSLPSAPPALQIESGGEMPEETELS